MSACEAQDEATKDCHRAFIQNLFDSVFKLPIQTIQTLPRCNNNFVHFVKFSTPLSSDTSLSVWPGTNAIPKGTSKAVFRVGNPAAMFNHAVKVENTVAMMQLTRQALSAFDIVPKVYAWSGGGEPSETGWILEDYMRDVEIESRFHTELARESQRYILSQMATILKTVQDFQLPPKAAGFGGLAFGDNGEVVNVSYVVEPYNGPYPDMISMYKSMLQAQIAEADRSPVVKGYKHSEIRSRLDKFAEKGLADVLTRILPRDVRPNLIIGDLLRTFFDPDTFQVTGLVDYDCSHTGHPLHEYFFSSFSLRYCVMSLEPEIASAIFRQYPAPLPESKPISGTENRDHASPQWELMELFEKELVKAGAARPSNIPGAEEITKVYEFMAEVCPWHFVMDRWIKKQTEEKLQACKKEQMATLDKALTNWGF
ncbi:unnamed protein product [Aureobasidium mustum]|uniref:Aminoglycoside phosphotransferase domain-containing protein n=1 Tax=Aureobasidium mustum TaxID=2773714 RepID=A0A9N8JC16_9PEZI|nr:unnamed protein product [Aureobasidium mustum]